MSIISKIAGWDGKFAWSFFGFLLALFFGGLTIYNEFIKNPNPDLSVQILSDTNVLDVRENVPELRIVYGDVDIKNLNQTLSVIVFRVQNTGGAAILNSYYDEKATPRIHLTAGRFVKVEQIGATNEYLRGSAQPMQLLPNTLQLARVILEPGESYTIKALFLHGTRSGLSLRSSGKVAGARDIPVLSPEAAKETESFWSSAVSGPILIQLVRAPVYFGGFVLLLLATFGSSAFVIERLEGFSRRRVVKQFKRHHKGELGSTEISVLDVYRESGLRPLVRVKELLGNEEKLRLAIERLVKARAEPRSREIAINEMDVESIFEARSSSLARIDLRSGVTIGLLEKLCLASFKEDGGYEVNADIEKFLSRFIDYVNIKKS